MNAKVYRDTLGVPHLQAGDPLALAYLQGLNVAADRAWQIEFERSRLLGTTAAFLGQEGVDWDVLARQARLADTAQQCFANLEEDTREWISAYVAGVNHGLPSGARRAPEFEATGLTPQQWEPWTPVGIWMAVHLLFAGFPTKLWREQVARHLGDAAVELFNSEGPSTAGSNGWLIPGHKTASGAPIIAGDPHRYVESPGVYQQLRLTCPEYDVVGLAVPGIPGIAHFGHAGKVAWAITNAMADYQDLYAEQLRRTPNGVEALGPNGWTEASVHTELVEVKGAEPLQIEVIETARGPVIIGGPAHRPKPASAPGPAHAGAASAASAGVVSSAGGVGVPGIHVGVPGVGEGISLRYPPRVTGRIGFDTLPALLRATSVADVDSAFDAWMEPVNVVMAADTAGGLLHRTAGLVPVRHADNRLRVVPAWEAEHEWQGWHDPMPRATVDDFAVMANARELAAPLGVEFAAPHRSRRIRQLLEERDDWTVEDMPSIHKDTLLGSAGSILDLLPGLEALSPEATSLREQLLQWDRRMDAASNLASSFAAVRKALVRRLAEHPTIAVLEEDAGYPEVFVPWVDTLAHTYFALENLIATDLLPDVNVGWLAKEALEEVAHRKPRGPWGHTHQLTPLHALRGPVFTPDEEHYELALSGDHHCVMSTSPLPGISDVCIRASAARYAWDLADRSTSRWIVPLGTSGVLGDPHHHDQLPLWLKGDLAPIEGQLIPEATTFEQHIGGLGLVQISPVVPAQDIDIIHDWVSADRAHFWGMTTQSREEVLVTYEFLDSLPTHHAYLVHLDDKPVALLQTYDPQADPVGTAYKPELGDLGVHFLIAPGETRPGFTGRVFEALGNFLLLQLGHPRLVADPDVENEKAVARVEASGFTLGPEVTFTQHDGTTKTAQLAFFDQAGFATRSASTSG